MTTRRHFLASLVAASALPATGWAAAGNPAFLSAAQKPDGSYALFGLSEAGRIVFEIALPGRGHAAAAHPTDAIAVAFARRPGNFALVIDCAQGVVTRQLTAPEERHFYGHGAFSLDGTLLFTTENDYENAEGRIGVWDVMNGFARIGEFSSGGVGPHDIKMMPDGLTLVVANGGIETHPDSGREKLNIPMMQPNLSYVGLNGEIVEQTEPAAALHKTSLRHLAVNHDGRVAVGGQWQGGTAKVPLIYTHKRGEALRPIQNATEATAGMQGYVGSIAFGQNGATIVATSPRGNQALVHELTTGASRTIALADVCGVAQSKGGIGLTTGEGRFFAGPSAAPEEKSKGDLRWDNHLIAI
jgi:hypothetical protein